MLIKIKCKKIFGVTLVEMMLVLVVATVLLGGVLGFYGSSIRHTSNTISQAYLKMELSTVADFITAEIRRAGYWNQFGVAEGTENPFTATGLDVSTNGSQDCILFSYDRDADGVLASAGSAGRDERVGFRLLNNAIQVRFSDSNFSCTSTGGWENLTDPNLVEITDLDFQIVTKTLDAGSDYTLLARQVVMSLSGYSVKRPSLARTLSRTIKIRNNYVASTGGA